ncbi:MAG: hypothetical protein NC342_06765 [Pseudoflavonifractor sp.]|nr:hypothetical protein [Alloprevotella sp.]MCM1117219.1 hypothetical protein [Pseudoflavonifractor sp.]
MSKVGMQAVSLSENTMDEFWACKYNSRAQKKFAPKAMMSHRGKSFPKNSKTWNDGGFSKSKALPGRKGRAGMWGY